MKASTILGLDFGERRIGVALSDTGKTLASGLMTIDRRQTPDVLSILAEVIREESVDAIVIGYPLRTDGKIVPGGKTEAVDEFIATLESRFALPVHREDESYTSQLAAESLKARTPGKRNRQRGRSPQDKAAIDRVAACYILQDFLNQHPRKTIGS